MSNKSFLELLSNLSSKATKVSDKLKDSVKLSGPPIILHPQVWKNESEARMAQEDLDFREKAEILRQFQKQMSLK
jgi:hypothetical protein